MPELTRPLGHEHVVRGLVESARKDSLPHALLFTGRPGIGKYRSALWLAATLLCETGGDEPCGGCGPCTRVARDSHADLHVVDHRASGQDRISIHFVATRDPRPRDGYQGPSVEAFLGLRAEEGRGKFVIVREADGMNEEAQNAFLKMLEEPRPGVHLLLESGSPGSLLETVRSRVVTVRFDALDTATTNDIIASLDGAGDADELLCASRMAGGSPGEALRLVQRAAPAMQRVLADVLRGELSAAEGTRALFDLDGEFPGRTAAAVRRTRARTILDLGLEILTDLERVVSGVDPVALPHGDVARGILDAMNANGGGHWETPVQRRIAEAWLRARSDLELNLSPEALVDRVLAARS